jgi:hypothetical protein
MEKHDYLSNTGGQKADGKVYLLCLNFSGRNSKIF